MSLDPEPLLVGDVGGTHARFAVSTCATGSLDHRVDLTGEFPDFGAVLRRFRELSGLAQLPQRAVPAQARTGPATARSEYVQQRILARARQADDTLPRQA